MKYSGWIISLDMPWTKAHVREQREQFVIRAKNKAESFKNLCASFGISRPTGYLWVNRYRQLGNVRDLTERARRPHRSPNQTPPEIEAQVLELRDRLAKGAAKIAAALRQKNIHLAPSTVNRILHRHGRIGVENKQVVPWMMKVLLTDNALPLLQRELPDAAELPKLVHFLSSARLSERKKAMAVISCLKAIPAIVISSALQIHRRAVTRYFNRYTSGGAAALFLKRKVKRKDDEKDKQLVFSLLHAPPSDYGINRTSWKMDDLQRVLRKAGHQMSEERIRRLIKAAGFRWRRAKVVLTSRDPDYRAKLEAIKKILSELQPDEVFFSIDEYGPFAVKCKGGRKRVAPGENYVVPQWQKSKGWTIVTAALELSRNQVTHFYSLKKNTDDMIKMTNLLRDQYRNCRTIYLSWDAASWHISRRLLAHLQTINQCARRDGYPIVKTAPLPAGSQFLNVIESVFSGMARAIIHNSNYPSLEQAKQAIDRYFKERNEHFSTSPRRAGGKIWKLERVPSEFSEGHNCKDPRFSSSY
jgi:transposase